MQLMSADDEGNLSLADDLIRRGRSQGCLSLADLRTAFEKGFTPTEARSVLRELAEAGVRLQDEDVGYVRPDNKNLVDEDKEDVDSGHPQAVTGRVNGLITDLISEPRLLFSIGSREFEMLIAEILRRRGYHIELTRPSRDGGVDVYASRMEPNGLAALYFVQCKRQSQQNRVGVRPVRELYGVVCARNATGGIVVTTSFFTSSAREYQSDIESRMSLQDHGDVLRWLRETAAQPNKGA